MDWLIRFSLGLPARSSDAAEVRALLPELHSERWEPARRRLLLWFPGEVLFTDDFVEELREWVSEVAEEVAALSERRCTAEDCPLQLNHPIGAAAQTAEVGELFLRYQVAAGGPNSKPPRESFFDLVRKVHPESDRPREVILTDPYIYADVSEEGLEGGFNNLVGYLKALGIEATDAFTLTTTPSPKRGTKTARSNLQRLLKRNFRHIAFKDFSPRLAFHDRLYLVRHKSGALRGLFGPSLNGLSSSAIVLMGELTDPQPLHRIRSWLG